MGHHARALAHSALLLGLAGCGDTLIITGDAPGVMRIVAGVPEVAGDSLGERATESLLHEPSGVAAGADGTLYLADSRNARVLRIRPDGRAQVVIDHGDRSREPQLRRPGGLALDSVGGLLVADPEGGRVWRIELESRDAMPVAGTGGAASGDTTRALETELEAPAGVAAGADGAFYVSERSGHRVRRVGADGSIATIAGDGTPGFAGDGGGASDARLDAPQGLALAGEVLYVADSGNQRVRAIDLVNSTISTVAGSGGTGFGGDGGPAVDALLNDPVTLTVTADRQVLFVAETGNDRVRSVRLDSGVITTFSGTGASEFQGDLLSAAVTPLPDPRGLAASPFDILFVSVAGHHIVYRTALGLLLIP
ncbi:MAG: hypothetical protein GWN99_06075 [Gemmatimonadetes bacterium]|uniref:Teneurin NHL domain-containing protein n=1 Tax=Candidatus Kutchimonas denitrificans TaxID=3056748 RepID=A0AAE4Z9C2_9BACT|nr:hypothetical protein [Gemmatimonadota bacterium]NIR76190.1 hypothetical protein [Candidatus Kutchimonas denitrificans]NIS00630.1 hypothetical protein [Gemmatimonadota bacterium]NIT66775.1 hypothetical protein [Gemmatimonadota bacterium]NIV23374.1 hypothetical protein [Gemmatimonadota bacterium]